MTSAHKLAGHTSRAPAARGMSGMRRSVAVGPGANASAFSRINSLYGNYASLAYNLPWEVLDLVELLSTYNADYSQAVDNIRTLANSGHELYVDADSSLQVRRIRDQLEEAARTIQMSAGGIDGVIDKLLDQAAVYGAMAGEWIVAEDFSEVVDFADVNPKSIRFFWEQSVEQYEPYQKVSAEQQQLARDRGQEVRSGCIKLNPITFHYFSFDAAPGSPYGTPPFVAALEHINIQRDMVSNMSQIVKKIGLLGLVDMTVERLQAKPGESEETFAARASQFLEDYVQAGEDMVRDGGIVHFDDVTVESTNIAGNAAGATNIFKQNEELIFSGLKSMPSVQGRSYSTTETYAGVAYDIIIRNTKRYQRSCKRMVEAGYWLAAQLAGMNPSKISIEFNQNKTLQRLQNSQAMQGEIRNYGLLWRAGILDQRGFAQELGYADVDKELADPPPEIYGATRISEQLGNDAVDPTGGGKPDNQNNN
jgi:hypothetical protein